MLKEIFYIILVWAFAVFLIFVLATGAINVVDTMKFRDMQRDDSYTNLSETKHHFRYDVNGLSCLEPKSSSKIQCVSSTGVTSNVPSTR